MKTDTIFDLASLSKSVGCATSVMVLVDQGKLNVHDPVGEIHPRIRHERQGGHHRRATAASLQRHDPGQPDEGLSRRRRGRRGRICSRSSPPTQPGTKFVYSDVNFEVLGELVHRVSGQPLDQFAHEHVFEPLGMTDTTYNPPQALRDRCALAKKRDGKWMIGEVHDPRCVRAGRRRRTRGRLQHGRRCRQVVPDAAQRWRVEWPSDSQARNGA